MPRKKPTKKSVKKKPAKGKSGEKPAPVPGISDLVPPFPGGIETLLDCEHRKPLPQIPNRQGRKCILNEIIQFAPEIYAKMILLIRCGSTIQVSAERCGINPSTFHDWVYRGGKDLLDEEDTYYSRFFLDVRRAVATRRSEVEIQLSEEDPKRWLSHGPGRMFDNTWSKDQKQIASKVVAGQKSIEAPDDNEIEGTFVVKPVNKEAQDVPDQLALPSSQGDYLEIDEEEGMNVMKAWEKAGYITINDPELKKDQNDVESDAEM